MAVPLAGMRVRSRIVRLLLVFFYFVPLVLLPSSLRNAPHLAFRLRRRCRYQGVYMCGIAGLLSLGGKPVSQEEVQSMCDAMVHRGPNDDGYYAGQEAVLGMRRLSIIDIEGGHQPVHNEDRTVWVVFNGEIYNFKSLRVALE